MRRIVKSPLKQALKEYLLETCRFKKSDKIYVSSVTVNDHKNGWYFINVRRAFVKGASIQRVIIDVNVFQEWVILKKRTEKILKLKENINVTKKSF